MDLADGSNERVVNVEVDSVGRDKQAEGGIEAMRPGYDEPGCLHGGSGLQGGALRLATFEAAESTFGLVSCGELNHIGNKKMAGNESVEDGPKDEISFAVIVAADAYQDAVLVTTEPFN